MPTSLFFGARIGPHVNMTTEDSPCACHEACMLPSQLASYPVHVTKLTYLLALCKPATSHRVLEDLECIRLEAEYPFLRLSLFLHKEPDHNCALVQSVEDLRNLRRAGQRYTRHRAQ